MILHLIRLVFSFFGLLLTNSNDCQRSTNGNRKQWLNVLSEVRRKLAM